MIFLHFFADAIKKGSILHTQKFRMRLSNSKTIRAWLPELFYRRNFQMLESLFFIFTNVRKSIALRVFKLSYGREAKNCRS